MRKPYKTLKPLYKYMIDHDISWYDIQKNVKLQPDVFSKVQSGIMFKPYVIFRLMDYLGCKYTDIVGYEI